MQAAQQSAAKSNGGTGSANLGTGSANQRPLPSQAKSPGTTATKNPSAQPGGISTSTPNSQVTSDKPGQPRYGGSASAKGSSTSAPPGVQPLAQERGSDWGLPNRGPISTGIQRAIQVQCLPDRLVLLQERGDYRDPTVVPMPVETAASIDSFVSAVWKRMEQWGIAGDNCYWKPALRVQVSPDAEARFAELSTLLDGSGLVIERR